MYVYYALVMGYVLHNALQLISVSTSPSDMQLQQRLNDMRSLADKSRLTGREKLHLKAVEQLEDG